MRAILALEDGTTWEGTARGRGGTVAGEVVFNTSMMGYQEILTDPSYAGQIVVMTYPLIGNYGVNPEDLESACPAARGFVVREMCHSPSSWRAQGALERFLEENGVIGLEGIDTRALTRRLREQGTMRGVLTTVPLPLDELVAAARAVPDLSSHDWVRQVTTPTPYVVGTGSRHAVLIDLGAKRNIARSIARRGWRVSVVPAWTNAEEVLGLRPDAVVLSNGPGDPRCVPYAIETARRLAGCLPLFGICLGHQILGLALGGDAYKLKYGHRGANHPVKDLTTGKVYITAQNHGYALREESLPPDVQVTHKNVNDGTVEGLRHKSLPVASVQYHPEASPGPRDSNYLFDQFLDGLAS